MNRIFLLVILYLSVFLTGNGQSLNDKTFIRDIIIYIDTLSYRLNKDMVMVNGEKQFAFKYNRPDEICEIRFFPKQESVISELELLPSSDFIILDSTRLIENEYFKTKIQFVNLNKTQFLALLYKINFTYNAKKIIYELKLFPFTNTTAQFNPLSDELYIGEEKIFDLYSNNVSNIKVSSEWTVDKAINYRLSENNGQLRIHLLPSLLGNHVASISLKTNKPNLGEKKEINYDIPEIRHAFKIKASRLAFLSIDQKEITYNDYNRRNGIEIQMEGNRQIQLMKTYRVEDQEMPGGTLMAEIFTRKFLANDRLLCIIRPYNIHKQSDGYLYIKDGDDPKFITNISITPNTEIKAVKILHEGMDWTENLTVYPGETIDLRIEGDGLHKARFYWEEVQDLTTDTMTRNEKVQQFRLKIPLQTTKNRIALYNNNQVTGVNLNVREYQVPRQFDFISLDYGKGSTPIIQVPPTTIQRYTIGDVAILFDNSMIDNERKLYGKQYIDMDIRLIGKQGELIEFKQIKNILICPDEKSPRSAYYKDRACTKDNISLNKQLLNKTYNLIDFSKIQLEVRHQQERYNEPAFSKQFEIVLQRRFVFDVDLSFPAGLLIQNIGQTEAEKEKFETYQTNFATYEIQHQAYLRALEAWDPTSGTAQPTEPSKPVKPEKAAFTDNLGGISMAIIMQFSFPDQEKVGRTKPFRVGAGFLAINAFNFSENATRDLAAVVLASLYPLKPGKLFSLPIHIGIGYKFQDKIPFLMLSPGIGIRF